MFDADTDTYSNINISTAGGDDTFPPFTYSPMTSTFNGDADNLRLFSRDLIFDEPLGEQPQRFLFLGFGVPGGDFEERPLTNAGGTFSLFPPVGITQNEARGVQTAPTEATFAHRALISGIIEAPGSPSFGAPEPPSAALMMLGLSVFAITLYLKRSRHSA